jgi:hypothetical protein
MRLKIAPDAAGELKWSLVRSREVPECVADGVRSYNDVSSCCRAAAQMLAARADCMLAVQRLMAGGGGRCGAKTGCHWPSRRRRSRRPRPAGTPCTT